MKRFHRVLGALALSIGMLVTAVTPAVAAIPAETGGNTPVAWVSWGGSNSRVKDEFNQSQLSFLVKRLGDGTTVGHMHYQDRVTGLYASYRILDSYFYETDGVKVAEIFTSTPYDSQYGSFTVYNWWILTDGGEPGATRDGFQLYAFYVPAVIPFVPDWNPPGPPVAAFPPNPGWWQFQNQDWIPGGNIQIHITEDYRD